MPRGSKVARVQQVGTLLVAAAGLWWWTAHWHDSPAVAELGAVLIWFGYAIVLAVEFIALALAGRDDPAPRPSAAHLLRAWAAETWWNAVVFAWWQPFRWNAIPDDLRDAHGHRGVVLIHGFVCNRGMWTPWLRLLRDRGVPFAAVNLEPMFGSIDGYAATIEDAVRRVEQATGQPPLLVCHSMGGVAARAWLRDAGAVERVHRVVTIGSPHGGTWFGHFSHAVNGRQMRLDGAWLRELGEAMRPDAATRFTCWYSNCDNMVFPVTTATLAGADNRLVEGPAHVELAYHPRVMSESLALALEDRS
jgi:triacylglycerol lipase